MSNSNVFFRAWGIKRTNPSFTFRKALKVAWQAERLRRKMAGGNIVEFVYSKTDGTIRIARGTIPADGPAADMAARTAKQRAVVNYFDVDADGWRSFHPTKLAFAFI